MRSVKGFVNGVLIEIYDRAVKDEDASEKQDIPVFNSSVYIKKKVPNSRDLYDQPAKSADYDKYPDLFTAFEAGKDVPLEGLPIEMWPALDVAQVATMKAANIYTVQALANLAETGLHRLPVGYRNLKTKAQKWLANSDENELLRKQNADLLVRVEALETNQKKSPGRPRKKKAA